MPYPVLDIANELLRLADEGNGDLMTNLKLQKLLYYQQGFHLAYFGQPLFNEDIEAWMYGPVVPVVYRNYEANGRVGIEPDATKTFEFNSEEELRLFLKVYDIYNQYSASYLIEMTHHESPWMQTPVGVGNVISKESMKEFFKTMLN
jgi:uncharacterized phage-associated protein